MNDKQRTEFEKWYRENINKDGPFMGCGKLMRSEHAMFGLMCWQAAISSVVVELPDMIVDSCDHFVYLEHLVKQAIADAGVKYNEQ